MEFLDNLHRLMDPFIPPPLVHGPLPPSDPMNLPPGKRSTCSSTEMVHVLPSHPCMMAHTGWFTIPTRIFAWLSVTRRTQFRCHASSLCWLLARLCLLCLDVEAAFLASSVLRSLLVSHVLGGRPKKDPPPASPPPQLRHGRLLVSNLLSQAHRVGGAMKRL